MCDLVLEILGQEGQIPKRLNNSNLIELIRFGDRCCEAHV